MGFYPLWFVSCGLCILDLYVIIQAVGAISIALGADMWTFPFINRFALFILGAIAVIFFFLSEAQYRKAAKVSVSRLLQVFAWVTGIQIGLLGLSYLLMLIPLSS